MKHLLLFLLFAFLIYGGSLMYGFSQDDWYFLAISQAHSVGELLLFFSPWHQQGFPFYRPLGTQLYFYLANLLGGLAGAPLIMHLFMLTLLGTSGFLLSLLAKTRKLGEYQSFLVGLIYIGSSVHFLSLYYIAATQQLLESTLMLASLYFFSNSKKLAAYLCFFLALLSKESALLLPVYLFLLSDWKVINLKSLLKNTLSLAPYLIMSVIYLALRLLSRAELQSEYQLVFGMRAIGAAKIYLSFIFGYYEKIQDYVLPLGFKQYLIDTFPYGYLTLIGSLVSLLTVIYLGLAPFLTKSFSRVSLQYLLAFVVGVAPWLLLPDHIFPHYLDLPLAFFALLMLSLSKSKIVATILAAALILANFGGIKSSEILHWTVLRARLNAKVVPELVTRGLCNSSAVTLVGNPRLAKELSYSLSLSNGPRVLCNNPNLQVYYKDDAPAAATTLDLEGID